MTAAPPGVRRTASSRTPWQRRGPWRKWAVVYLPRAPKVDWLMKFSLSSGPPICWLCAAAGRRRRGPSGYARHDLLQAPRRETPSDADGDQDSLSYLGGCRRLCLRRLGLQTQQLQEVGHAWNAESATSSMSTPLKSSTKWPATIQSRILWTAWSASAVLLKCQTDVAEPAHGQIDGTRG